MVERLRLLGAAEPGIVRDIVAKDDDQILTAVEGFSGKGILTPDPAAPPR